MFGLSFRERASDSKLALGDIVIGEFSETFESALGVWRPDDYRASWVRSSNAVINNGFARFVTSVGPPGAIYWGWACWRRGEDALLINCLVLSKQTRTLRSPQDTETLFCTLPEDHVSRWTCPIADIVAFAARVA